MKNYLPLNVPIPVAFVVILFLAFWWVSAPRYIEVPNDAMLQMDACVELEKNHPPKDFYYRDEFDARGELARRCSEQQIEYWRANGSKTNWLKPPIGFWNG